MDVFDKMKRSEIMAKVKQKNTGPEQVVGKFLFSKGFRYRKNVKSLPGSPDIVLVKYKTVIFVHGCFWHGHQNCQYFKLPKSNVEFWKSKINSNQIRDKHDVADLQAKGWRVIIIWECELKNKARRERTLNRLLHLLKDSYLQPNYPPNYPSLNAAEPADEYGYKI